MVAVVVFEFSDMRCQPLRRALNAQVNSLDLRMNRNIEFRTKKLHSKIVLSMVASYVVFTLVFNWFTETEFQLWSFLVGVTTMVVIYLFLALFLFKKAHLSVTGGDVFLHGLKAELIAKRGIFGTQYIQITSNTEKGYHRLKVTKDQIALADWNLLLGKC
ncbi:hypothetical protein FXF12_07695, partial [Vibrio cholerae]